MKKLLVLAALITVSLTSYSQQFGVKGGLNVSKIKVELPSTSGNTDERTSFYVGGLVDFKLSKKLHIQPEILFSSEGAKDYKVNFVSIPVMLKYFVIAGVNIQVGPQVGFIVSAGTGTDSLKSSSIGLNGGLGYELNNGLFFEVRYNHGLSNFVKNGVGPKFYSRPFQIGIGYMF
ncbi:porin family protein [uncultured Tenacibaculum sp.]|uniref:porin family protein n=1 Tax=uncultured Tenacibaculum sp. TaxID=174713 RepID=UPI002607C856|nr:porin family protein [uncultured Tenacibaculum sp.]